MRCGPAYSPASEKVKFSGANPLCPCPAHTLKTRRKMGLEVCFGLQQLVEVKKRRWLEETRFSGIGPSCPGDSTELPSTDVLVSLCYREHKSVSSEQLQSLFVRILLFVEVILLFVIFLFYFLLL